MESALSISVVIYEIRESIKKAEAPDLQLLEQLHGFEHGSAETTEARDFGSYPESFTLPAGLLAHLPFEPPSQSPS